MLITKDEQKKLQSFVEKCLIENQSLIIKRMEDPEKEQAFIDYMLEVRLLLTNEQMTGRRLICTR